jgi:hypothetical protein
MYYDDDLKFWGIILAVIFGLVCAGIYIQRTECKTYGEVTGREVKLEFGTCFAKTSEGWFPIGQIRKVE